MADGKIVIDTAIDTSGIGKGMDEINNKVKGINSTPIDGLKKSFSDAAKDTKIFGVSLGELGGAMKGGEIGAATLGGVIGGLTASFVDLAMQGIQMAISAMVDFAKESFEVGKSFESQMSRVKAISGATQEEFATLEKAAQDFGASTVFSTTEVAKAMEYMGMAGWETTDMLNGMDGVLSLAAASGEDLALVSDTVTDVLTALGEEANQAGRMADVFAAAATNSNTNVGKMAYTMKYAAPVAGALSYSMEDVALATGLMANAGIKGETAGTALRSMFTELQGEVKVTSKAMGEYMLQTQNSDGSMRELNEIMVDLRTSFATMTESEKAMNAESLVGKEAMSGLLAIVNASENDFNKLADAINNSSGAAATMAGVMTDNVDGMLEAIGGKIESIQISLFNAFKPLIEGLLMWGDGVLGYFDVLMKNVSVVISNILDLFTPFFVFAKSTWDVMAELGKAVWDLAMTMLKPIFDDLGVSIDDTSELIRMMAEFFINGIKDMSDALMPLAKLIGDVLGASLALLRGDFDDFFEHTGNLAELFVEGVAGLLLIIPNLLIEACNTAIRISNKFFGTTYTEMEKISNDIINKADETNAELEKGNDKIVEVVEENNEKTYSSFDEIYDDIQDLTDDHYYNLKNLADKYNDDLTAIDEGYSDWKRELMREEEKRIDELNEKNANKNTLVYQKNRARELKRFEESLDAQIEADRKAEEAKYLTALEYEKKKADARKKYSEGQNVQSNSSFSGFGNNGRSISANPNMLGARGAIATGYTSYSTNTNMNSNSTYNMNLYGADFVTAMKQAQNMNRLRG